MKVIYWSGTGNTEKMAELISQGIKYSGKEVEVLNISDVNEQSIENEDILILGCPSMGSEELEESMFEPFIESISSKINGKKAALFGSYGWGDGEWMKIFKSRIIGYGCEVPIEPLIVPGEPDNNDCVDFGKNIANI